VDVSRERIALRFAPLRLPQAARCLGTVAGSKIHISFDGWTTKGGKRGFLGVVAHYVDSHGNL
jgi:hypothetical protein